MVTYVGWVFDMQNNAVFPGTLEKQEGRGESQTSSPRRRAMALGMNEEKSQGEVNSYVSRYLKEVWPS